MKFTVIGSGFSGSISSYFLLKRGFKVEMFDVGRTPVKNNQFNNFHFHKIKGNNQAINYFFGHFQRSLPNFYDKEIYKISNLLKSSDEANNEYETFNTIESFDKGGHGKSWGLNMHSYDKNDIKDWPINFDEYSKYINNFLKYCNISSSADLLDSFYPEFFTNQNCFELTKSDKLFLKHYNNKIKRNIKNNFYIGTARLALNMKFYNKNSSSKLWIDDNKNLKFTSEYNFLNKCFKNKNFKYFGARKVSNFIFKNNSISSINVKNLYRNKYETHKVSNLILCAGTLNTARIYLKSIQKHKKKISKLSIMDNKVIKIIFFNPLMIFKKNDNNSLPFNRLSGIKLQEINNEYPNYIHLEILNFINLFESSISKKLPFSFKFSYQLTSRLSKCIGVMTLFLPDKDNKNSYIKINKDESFSINYHNNKTKLSLQKKLIYKLKFDLLRNMCVPIKTIFSKNGSGIHYAGSLAMSKNKTHGVDNDCRSHLFRNLYVADASTFPSLPSKSITFNIMYNSFRVIKNLKIGKK